MTVVDFEPLSITIPLSEDPPGVFRVGNSRVLLEVVLRAYKRGESPEGIVRSYRALQLSEVYAIIGRYLTSPAPFDDYLRRCDEEAEATKQSLDEAGMTGGIGRDELLARASAKGLIS